MSTHYDIFIKCDFKEATPERVIDFIRYLTTPDYKFSEPPETDDPRWKDYWDEDIGHFLRSQPELEIISDFRLVARYANRATQEATPIFKYTLTYSAHHLFGDTMLAAQLPFIHWLTKYVEDGFIGYIKFSRGDSVDPVFARYGQAVVRTFNYKW